MTKAEIKETEHMAYLVPFNRELDVPYRAPKKLKEMIIYIYSHATVAKRQRQLFIDVSQVGSRMLVNDMACVAIAMVRYFVSNPQQFGGKMQNIELQVLSRMWKQVFNHMFKQDRYPTQEIESGEWQYIGVTYKMLDIENGFWDELLRVVNEKDYYQTNDSMVKTRSGVELRGRKNAKKHNPASLKEGDTHFEYLCSLE